MVTVITNKLKKQSLEDLPSEPAKLGSKTTQRNDLFQLFGESLEGDFKQRVHHDRRHGAGHFRTRSYPTRSARGMQHKETTIFDSPSSSTLPPASKKLCRSISVPEEDSTENSLSCWVPKASKVWHPVKVLSKTSTRPRSISSPPQQFLTIFGRSNEARNEIPSNNSPVNPMSTPPASPTPRPASAFAALSPKSSNKDKSTHKIETQQQECARLKRSRSQPCFERNRLCGIKRRIQDNSDRKSSLRPALDLAKMEESSYFRFSDRKRGLRIPKYSNKTEVKGLPDTYFTEHESFILKPIVSSPLDATASSIMITPTSSPTKQLEFPDKLVNTEKTLSFHEEKHKKRERKPSNVYDGIELDIASIEEDELY